METGEEHRAVMGIKTEDYNTFSVDIYSEGKTYENLGVGNFGTAYFIDDPKYLAGECDIDYFAKSRFVVLEEIPLDYPRIICKVTETNKVRAGEPLNRAKGLFLEYLVDSSRKEFDSNAKARCNHYARVINKVAPGSEYAKRILKEDQK